MILTVVDPIRLSLLDAQKKEAEEIDDRTSVSSSQQQSQKDEERVLESQRPPKYSAWNTFKDPAIVVLVLASSVRQIGGSIGIFSHLVI